MVLFYIHFFWCGGSGDLVRGRFKILKIENIFFHRRRRSHTGCKQLETWNPQFTKWLLSRTNWFLNSQYLLTTRLKSVIRYMGTVYLPSLEAIASCGYNSVWDRDARTYFPITRSGTKEMQWLSAFCWNAFLIYTQRNIPWRLHKCLVRCMVYYHTEDEWEQTMEVRFAVD